MASPPIEVREIEAMLVRRALDLCHELLPRGHREGHLWRCGNLAGDPGQSLYIRLDGAMAGNWRDMCPSGAGRDRGDLLWLIACVLFAGDLGRAVAWAKSWLRLDELDPGRIEQHRLELEAEGERRSLAAAEEIKRNRANARRRWLAGVPISGTIVETYLRSRAIDLRALGRAPGALRFNPRVQHGTGPDAVVLPAMVAVITNLGGEHIATHRTWLKADGSGKAGAAEGLVGKAKKVLGLFAGGHIPLWKGACGSMPLRDVPPGTDIWVAEGIEDGLTAACADPSLRIVCGVCSSNLPQLELPPQIGRLVFLRQNDLPGSDADTGWRQAIRAHRLAGRRVLQALPPKGVKDINELAQLALAEAAA